LYDGKVATTREAASEIMQAADELRIRSIIEGATEWAGSKAEIATLGWCFGGGWSMQAALQLDNQAVGCVLYYGMPESDTTFLKGLNCKVLGIFAENDKWINRKVVGAYEQSMNALKKPYDTYWYKADHAFANPSNSVFNEAAAEDAFQKTRQFLHQAFK
jgi:carboxymethylenebutenolidase